MAFVIFMGPWKAHIYEYVRIQITQHVVFVQCPSSTCWFSKRSQKMSRCFASKTAPTTAHWQIGRRNKVLLMARLNTSKLQFVWSIVFVQIRYIHDAAHMEESYVNTRNLERKIFFMHFSFTEHSLFSLNPQKRILWAASSTWIITKKYWKMQELRILALVCSLCVA